MRRLGLVTAWLCGGHAVGAALFWLLLQVPESNALMLAASVLVVAVLFAVTVVTETTAIRAIDKATDAANWRDRLRTPGVARRTIAFLLAVVAFAAIWWFTSQANGWWFRRTGEIDAVLMLRFGWTRTASLHAAVRWGLRFVRYAVGLSVALTLMRRWLDGSIDVAALRTMTAPTRLIEITAWLTLFVVLPWRMAWWRPLAVPPTWIEPAFVGLKLGGLYLLANVGWALILRSARSRSSVT